MPKHYVKKIEIRRKYVIHACTIPGVRNYVDELNS